MPHSETLFRTSLLLGEEHKMRKVTKKEWVDALRSGQYKQGKHFLNVNGTFCCLGVLADLTGCGWEDRMAVTESGDESSVLLSDHFDQYLDFQLSTTTQDHLANRNDHGESFSQIADYIEEHL